MKITKQRLKEIIKEELKNSQNEGFFSRLGARFGRANKSFPIHYRELKSMIDNAEEKMDSGRLSSSELMDVVEVVYDSYDRYTDAMMKATGADSYGWTQELNNDQLEQHQELSGRMRKITTKLYKKAEEQGNKEAARKARELEQQRRRDAEREREEREERARRAEPHFRSPYDRPKKDYTKDRPNSWMGGGQSSQRMLEGKITKSALKAIIAEELTKAEKARKKELEKELDDLKHK